MRRLLLVAILAGLGSFGCKLLDRAEKPVEPPPLKVAPPAPVRADEVTPLNAYDKARALNEELDRDIDGEIR